MKKRILSLSMVLALCLTLFPTSALAAEDSGAAIVTGGLCAHHTEHDEACGYVEGIAESPCTHEHSEECYHEVTSCTHEHTPDCYPAEDSSIPEDGTASSEDTETPEVTPSEPAEPTACSHVCSEESGCIKQELDCQHEHDDECGYAPAVEGQPCTYVCTLCGMTEITAWSWVDTQDVLDPESGVLALSASAESPVPYEDIVDLLPAEIEATTADGTETLSLDSWNCDDYPAEGAYTGSYAFNAVLPEGYGLTADAPALTVMVELDDEVMLMAEGTTHVNHPICGLSCSHGSSHGDVVFDKVLTVQDSTLYAGGKKLTKYKDMLKQDCYYLSEGHYYLDDDITLDSYIVVQGCEVTLCLNGHTITMKGGNAPVFQISNDYSGTGTLNLTDCSAGKTGTITHAGNTSGNTFDHSFGVWLMGGNFNMYGGTITGNRCGVFMYYSGGKNYTPSQVFTMYGGSITGNSCPVDANCGGVYFYEGTMKFDGSPVITDNKANGEACNLWLNRGQTVTIDGLTGDAEIGVSTETSPEQLRAPVDITGKCKVDYSRYFHPDNANFKIRNSEDNIVWLTTQNWSETHTHNWIYSNPVFCYDTIQAICNNRDTTCDANNKATVTINAPENTTYDGTEKAATLSKSDNWEQVSADDINITYDIFDSGWKDISGTPTEVGEYMASITVGEGENTATAYVSFEITNGSTPTPGGKTDPAYTAPTAKAGLTYTGQAQVLITGGNATGGTMQYKLGTGAYSINIPKATNAGDYTVYYKVVGDATHNDTAEQSITVKIGKAPLTGTPTFTPVTEAGKTIANVTLTAPTGWPEGTFSWMDGTAVLLETTPITQGASYHWSFEPNDTSNYTNADGDLVLWKDTSGGSSSNPGGGSSGGGSSSNSGGGSSGGGSSSNTSSSSTPLPSTPVTVPVSGDEKTIQVNAAVRDTTATIQNVDLSKLNTVIGDTVKTGVVTIDFSALKKVDTVKLPSNVVNQFAAAMNDPNNHAKGLEIVLNNGTSVELGAGVLDEKALQAKVSDITISSRPLTDSSLSNSLNSSLNSLQMLAVGNRPAFDINITIGGKPISDIGGEVTVSASYELNPGEQSDGIVVYYVDENGSKQLCETSYDPIRKQVSWKTNPLSPSSIYMIGYDEKLVKPDTDAYAAYTVQKGNTLSAIAKKHGCTVADIIAANSDLIKNPNRIHVGWQLKIPQK